MDTMLSGGFNDDLLKLANAKATQLKKDKAVLQERIEQINSKDDETEVVIDLAKSWKKAGYEHKKSVAMIMLHQIISDEEGKARVIWNI